MIKPNEVLVMMPVADGRNESQTTIGLFQIASFGMVKNLGTLPHCSNVALARNLCANGFLRTEFEWLFFLDYDIGFTADDFAIMMEYPGAPPPIDQELHDAATLMEVTPHNRPSFKTPLIVAAEYARKQEGAPPARLGLGFTRIHRSVFAELDKLNLESGEARIDAFMYEGQHVQDYFLTGCVEHRWMGEDHGFFALCRMAGIHPRVEQRCKLEHHGKKAYPYSPQQLGAQ